MVLATRESALGSRRYIMTVGIAYKVCRNWLIYRLFKSLSLHRRIVLVHVVVTLNVVGLRVGNRSIRVLTC